MLHARLLGRGAVLLDGGPPVAAWPRPAARRLVVLLVLAPDRRRSRDVLAELLFSHLPPDRAARSVSKALSQARAALRADVLEADRANVWIAEHCRVTTDVDELRTRLDRLLAVPASPARDAELRQCLVGTGMPLADDPYEDWAEGPRREIERLLADARRQWARTSDSAAAWDAVATHDPTDESAAVSLSTALVRQGDLDGALLALERCRAALEDLGVASARLEQVRLDVIGEKGPAPPSPPRLHGRGRELSTIVDRVHAGEHVGVAGPAGIGKSVLLAAAASVVAAEGWRVAFGTAVPEDRLVPLAALRSALRAVLPETIDPLARHAATVEADGAPTVPDLARLADEVDQALRRLPTRTLLVLDDVQWADPALQRLLVRLLARRATTWSLLMAARSDEPDAPLLPLPPGVHAIALDGVDDSAAHAIVEDELGGDGPVRDVVARGHGNPFFLVELARSAGTSSTGPDDRAATVPERVVELLRQRLEPVPGDARRLLEFLAVLGEEAHYDVLVWAGFDLGTDGAHLDELLRRRLLRDGPAGPRLLHPLLRDAVLSETNRLRRAELHERAARALDTAGREGRRANAQLSAAQHRLRGHLEAPLPERAEAVASEGFRAARMARRLLASDVAFELLDGALAAFESLPANRRGVLAADACQAWLSRGLLRTERADAETALADLQAALALAPDDDHRAKVWRALSYLPYRRGDLAAAVAVCEQGRASLAPDAELPHALLDIEEGWARHRMGQVSAGIELLAGAAAVTEEAGDWHLAARALDRLGSALDKVDLEASLATLEQAREACARTGDRALTAVIGMHMAGTLDVLGRTDEALPAITEAARIADEVGDDYTRSVAHWIAAQVHTSRGDLVTALAERDAEIALLTGWGNHMHLAGAHAHRSSLLRQLGRAVEAEEAARVARHAAGQSDVPGITDRIERDLVG